MREYDGFYDMPRHISTTKAPMPVIERAAQFAPYAALVGFDGEIREAGRLTEERIYLDECEINEINRRLCEIAEADAPVRVRITYFLPDPRKCGGSYPTETVSVKGIDTYSAEVISRDGKRIAISSIISIGDIEYESTE